MSNQPANTSRRNFLRAGAATTAMLASGVHARGESESQEDKAKVRIAIVGCGGRGSGASADSLTINKNATLAAMADVDGSKCKKLAANLQERFGEQLDVPAERMYSGLDGYQKILEDPDIQIVMFATPPGFRPRHILEAVSAGKNVFAEKPSCVDPAGYKICLAADAAAKAKGTSIVTGTQYRRQANYIGAVEQIRDGAIGDIVSGTTRYCSNGIWYKARKEGETDAEYQLRNWMHFVWLSGDQIAEQAVHNIDAMNWVFGGPPESAYGSGGRFTRPKDSEMWDNVNIDYVYPGDRILSFMCRQIPGSQGDNGSYILGTKGTCYIGAFNRGSWIKDRDGNEVWKMGGKISDAYKQEHKDLVNAVVTGNSIVELKQTADSSLTAVLGRMAAYTGKKVTWDFVTKESGLDLFPKDFNLDMKLESPGFAVPGKTKLV